MKKLLVVSAIAAFGLTSAAFAGGLPEEMPMAPSAVSSSDTGVYLGIEGGYGLTNWKNLEKLTGGFKISNDNGVVGRAFLGYDINRYFATEVGYSYFFNKVKAGNDEGSLKTQNVDLMLKLKAPVVDNFDLYAKIGGNYLMSKGDDISVKNFNVAFGAGADYSITPNIIANVEWLRFNGNNKVEFSDDAKYQPSTDAFMVGLRYKFDL